MVDVRARLAELIEAPDGDTLLIAGQRLTAPGQAQGWAERLREQLAHRFVERRPHATEVTWRRFVTQLREFAKNAGEPGDELLESLYVLIDGL